MASNYQSKIVLAGANDVAVKCLDYLVNEVKYPTNLIYIIPRQNDDGKDSWQKSLAKRAKELSLPIIKLEDSYNIENLLFLSVEFDKIIRPKLFKTTRLFNFHFSMLPKYKGIAPTMFPILNGETSSGVTLHYIDEGIDTGDIIAQIPFTIDINDTSRIMFDKYGDNSFELFKKHIMDLINDNIKSTPQPNISSSYYSKKDINYSNITINLNKTAYEIHNQLRAYIFPEYQLPKIQDVRIYKSELTNDKMDSKKIIEEDDKFLISGIDKFIVKAYKETK